MAKGRRVGEGPLSNQRKEVRRGGRKGLLRDAGRRGGREVRLPVELQLTASREESF